MFLPTFRCLLGFEGSGDSLELVLLRENSGVIEVSFRLQQNILIVARERVNDVHSLKYSVPGINSDSPHSICRVVGP